MTIADDEIMDLHIRERRSYASREGLRLEISHHFQWEVRRASLHQAGRNIEQPFRNEIIMSNFLSP
jgi:hypothetical protein